MYHSKAEIFVFSLLDVSYFDLHRYFVIFQIVGAMTFFPVPEYMLIISSNIFVSSSYTCPEIMLYSFTQFEKKTLNSLQKKSQVKCSKSFECIKLLNYFSMEVSSQSIIQINNLNFLHVYLPRIEAYLPSCEKKMMIYHMKRKGCYIT